MSMYKNLMTACCAAVFALGLAACGGGGSDSPTASAPATTPAEPAEPTEPTEPTKPGLDPVAKALAAAIDKAALPDRQDMGGDAGASPPTDFDHIDDKGVLDKDLKFTMSAPMTYTRMNEADGDTPASTDTVIIHNNKGADESVGYETHYEGMDPTRPVGDDDGAITVVAPDAGNDVITDSVTIEGTGSIISIAADGTTGDSVKGTFHGLAGTFACASGCTINVLSDGKYQTEATDLMFTPTLDTSDGADPAADQVDALKVTIADPDYMHWGVWINEAKDKDGMPVTKVSAFFGGTMASRITTAGNDAGVRDLEGTASYAGPATGVYVRKEFGAGGDPEHLYSGQFSATASLTARFGGGNVAANDQFSVVGKVTNFMDGDEIVDADWAVTLGAAPFGTSATTVTDDAPMFAGMTSTQDDAKGVTSGNWQGQFFGAVTDDDANTADEDETVYPSGIAGQFNGHFTNGHVLGAFGAKKQ